MSYWIAAGKIYDPQGKQFLAGGLNIDNSVPASTLLALFPNSNYFRVPMGGYDQPAQWEPLISALLAAGKVVVVEHHPWPLVNALSGAELAKEAAWYGLWATYAKDKPLLWLETMNEPQGGDMSTQHVATVNAIRGTGNTNPIGLQCGVGGGNPGAVGRAVLRADVYAGMSGTFWTLHFYGWVTKSNDQATVNAALLGSVASHSGILAAADIRSKDGVMPVILDETGPSTSGQSLDFNAVQVQQAVTTWAWQQGHSSGFAGWHWNADKYNAVQTNGKLNAWGVVLAAGMTTMSAALKPTAVPPPPPVAFKPSPEGTVISLPGLAITDTSGNLWTLTPSGQVAVNGVPDITTAKVTLLEYAAGGKVCQMNSAGLWWSKTAPSVAWISDVAPPLPAVSTPAVTHTTVTAKITEATRLIAQANALLASVATDVTTLTP